MDPAKIALLASPTPSDSFGPDENVEMPKRSVIKIEITRSTAI